MKTEQIGDHACAECRFYYRAVSEQSKQIYSGLSDAVVTITVDKMSDFCGKAPGGTLLAVEAPVCASFQAGR